MDSKLKERLEIMKCWLENPDLNYNKKHFLEDWKKYAQVIEQNFYLGFINENIYKQCKNILMDYMHLFCK